LVEWLGEQYRGPPGPPVESSQEPHPRPRRNGPCLRSMGSYVTEHALRWLATWLGCQPTNSRAACSPLKVSVWFSNLSISGRSEES
jgi:hypothetical protein